MRTIPALPTSEGSCAQLNLSLDPWSLFLAVCVPTSLTKDGLLGNKAAMENIPISQHVLGACWMDGCRSDEAVGERNWMLRRVMGEGADGQEGGEGALRRVLLGIKRELLPSTPTLPMPLPCPGDAQVSGAPGQHVLAESAPP